MCKKTKLLANLKENPFVLAPMAGITDHSFRTFMKKHGAGIVVSELVSATGIQYSSQKTLDLMSFDETQRPVGIQLFGEDPENMAEAARVVERLGADFVDVNFGCPVPKVVKKGAGSAMLKDLPLMETLLKAMVKAVNIPVTIKIRTGWDSHSRNASEVLKVAHDSGITWVAIHGRTRAQGYEGLADWDFIADVASRSPLPVLGNGDILTPEQACDRLKNSGCAGVLIGRGALKNPFIFQQSLALLHGTHSDTDKDYQKLFSALKNELALRCSDHILQIQLKKFAAWFATGYPGASVFRKEIFQAKATAEIEVKALQFFETFKKMQAPDTSQDGFLMGGHG